jgi:hypothetical protein
MAALNENAITLLSTTTVSLQTAAATTLYTVPTGKRCVLTELFIRCGSAASTTAKFTSGQVGALTDFLAEVTCTNLAATYDTLRCVPIPATTPLKSKSYAAGTVLQINITTADTDGSTDAIADLFGYLYSV